MTYKKLTSIFGNPPLAVTGVITHLTAINEPLALTVFGREGE